MGSNSSVYDLERLKNQPYIINPDFSNSSIFTDIAGGKFFRITIEANENRNIKKVKKAIIASMRNFHKNILVLKDF